MQLNQDFSNKYPVLNILRGICPCNLLKTGNLSPKYRKQFPPEGSGGFRIYSKSCRNTSNLRKYNAKAKDTLRRGQALQEDWYGQVQARPVQDAPHPNLQEDQDQAPPALDHPGL